MSITKSYLLFATVITFTFATSSNDVRVSKFTSSNWKLFEMITVSPTDIHFYYYNQLNKENATVINLGNFSGYINGFNPNLPTHFIGHGMRSDYTNSIEIKDLILNQQHANVFLLDYKKHAALFYTLAVTSVRQFGPIIGGAIEKIHEKHGLPYSSMFFMGHSLGAQVSGIIGGYLQGKINCIIGIDAASPLFSNRTIDIRLDSTDAQFVQVIHSSSGLQGIKESIGHADYFPNGDGMNQPGCGTDVFGGCAHLRSYYYYLESLQTGGFVARSCASYDDYKKGKCEGNSKSYMGELFVDKGAKGKYYFDTNSESPFATGKC